VKYDPKFITNGRDGLSSWKAKNLTKIKLGLTKLLNKTSPEVEQNRI